MQEEKNWSYKKYEIKEGLKPGSNHFQYYFVVSEGGERKCYFCVWIENGALTEFTQNKDFDEIASAQREAWRKWVQEKIDRQEFSNTVLKLDKEGQKEIDLSEMNDKPNFE